MPQNMYTRRLVGQQSGVQVNIPQDKTERQLQEVGDQTFATVGAFTRGRIDVPMLVASSKLQRYLGGPQSLRITPAASTYLQIVDAFSTGAAAAVVQRIASDDAVNNWIVLNKGAESESNPIISLSENDPTGTNWILAIKIADCINEGVNVTFENTVGKPDEITVTIRERKRNFRGQEVNTGDILYVFTGSLDVDSVSDVNQSNYIADVVERFYGDWIQIETKASTVAAADAVYGTSKSKVMVPYVDGGVLTNQNYLDAAKNIGETSLQYRYIMSDTPNVALVNALIQVAIDQNRKMYQEIDGNLTPAAAIAWKDQFELDDQEAMYFGTIWTPVRRQDPTYKNGIIVMPSVGQSVGLHCARNANYNAYGLPPLHRPIAGREYRLTGTNFKQIYNPDDVELAALAEARINPCLFQEYHDTNGYVWADSLSGAKKSGISRLNSAAEISIWFQHYFGRYGKSLVQKPMTEAIRLMENELQRVCEWAQASEWLVSSDSLDGDAFRYLVQPNERYPDDEMIVTTDLGINGVLRRLFFNTNMRSRD